MSIGSAIAKTFTNQTVLSAITSTIFIILLGYWFRKRGVFGENFGKVLTKVVLSAALPALVLNSFMQPIDSKSMQQGANILVWGILVYVLLIIVTPFMYPRGDKDKNTALSVATTFGSTTFFGIPIVGAIYGPKGVIYSSIFNVGYRIFLYSYGYIKMSGLKMSKDNVKKMFLNPIVIVTFLGLILWMIQGSMPQVTVPAMNKGVATGTMTTVAFYRIDQTAIWLWKPLNFLQSLASPLAWLAIGCTLGSSSFKEVAEDKMTWLYSFNKVIIVPLINLVVLLLINRTGVVTFEFTAVATVVIMMATPTAAVVASYAIGFDHDALMISKASFLSTVCAVVASPIWIAILNVLNQTGILR